MPVVIFALKVMFGGSWIYSQNSYEHRRSNVELLLVLSDEDVRLGQVLRILLLDLAKYVGHPLELTLSPRHPHEVHLPYTNTSSPSPPLSSATSSPLPPSSSSPPPPPLSQMGGSNLPRPHLVIFYFFPSA